VADAKLIAAPTMFLPHDVSGTRNAYHAFMAALCLASRLKVETLVCPALCCGYGRMDPAESARQVRQAYHDFREGKTPRERASAVEHHSIDAFIAAESKDGEQPHNFDNREIHGDDDKLVFV